MQRFGQRDQLLAGARCPRTAASDDDRPLGLLQQLERRLHMGRFRLGAERRHARELRLDKPVHLGLFKIDLPFIAAELQMHRTRRTGGRGAKSLPYHVRDARHVVDGDVHLGHRLERRHVVDFLVDLAEFRLRIAPARHRDDRRMREIRVAQTRREIERTDHLRHADAGLARRARIAVGHVGGRFLAMTMDARDLGPALHFREGPAQNGRHHEDVCDAVARQHVGKHFGADAPRVVSDRHHAQAGSNFSATPLMQ